jgi:hypothetical protein
MIVHKIKQGIRIMEQDVGIEAIGSHVARLVRLVVICGRRAQQQI